MARKFGIFLVLALAGEERTPVVAERLQIDILSYSNNYSSMSKVDFRLNFFEAGEVLTRRLAIHVAFRIVQPIRSGSVRGSKMPAWPTRGTRASA